MIHYFIPYSIGGYLFDAYDKYADLVKDPEDWICFLDGDSCFLISDWGHLLERYIAKYPTMGMFCSYASRSGYPSSVPRQGNQSNTDILFHKNVAELLLKKYSASLAIKPYNRNVSGHLMLIKKSTWLQIRDDIARKVKKRQKRILGVDTMISHALLAAGFKIGLMRAVYVFHYFRLKEKGSKKHLLQPGEKR